MGEINELKQFLSQQAAKGELASAGTFTLDRRKALEKLSAFQLPFFGCWVLKLIQAAVASGCCTTIRVNITPRPTRILFEGSFDWSGSEILAAVLNPEQEVSRSLQHLAVGLRVLSFHDSKAWTLNLGEAGDRLSWDGEDFQLQAFPPGEGIEVLVTRDFKGELPNRLLERAHVCPIPLFLDGRRIDALELNPTHGYGVSSQPLALGFPKGELPSFEIPQSTGAAYLKTEAPIQQSLRAATETARNSQLPADGRCSLAFLLALHAAREPELVLFSKWNYQESSNRRYWIYDGVIVEVENFGEVKLNCSLGCFLSAQDLALDASGFGVQDNKEKRRRTFQSRQLLREGLKKLGRFDYQTLVDHEKNSSQLRASLLLLGGVLSVPASTAVAGFLVVCGVAGLVFGGSHQIENWQDTINKGLSELRKSL